MSDPSKEDISIETRRQIFQEELQALREQRLIPKTDYIRISRLYDRYSMQMIHKEKTNHTVKEEKKNVMESTIPLQEKVKKIVSEEPVISHEVETAKVPIEPVIVPKVAVKPEKTAEQLRERNISIVLITGVIFLLFGGLILATSTWGELNAALKVMSISLVSVFFAGMAFIASKLKIKQTAFAFLTLASLFIPISILSASYYQIFGEYLSLQGNGRGLLGLIGGVICFAIYMKIAQYFQSKVFVLISLVTVAMTTYFGLAYITFSRDVLLLLMALLNVLFLWNLDYVKSQTKLMLFKPYVFQFMMFKILAETFVTLTLFSNNSMYSFTLLILSVLFLLLAVKHQKLYFHFVFSIVFTYGFVHTVYQSFLKEYSIVAFAILPLIFIGLSNYLGKGNQALATSFRQTSLVTGGLVFIYVNAMAWTDQEAQIFLALLVLTCQFVYLSFTTQRKAYTYPALVLFSLSFVYLGFALDLDFSNTVNLLFVTQLLLYLGLYIYHSDKLRLFKESTLYITGSSMIGMLTLKLAALQWLDLSAGLAIISGLLYVTYRKDRSEEMRRVSAYGFPISLVVACMTLYPYFNQISPLYENNIEISVHTMIVAILSIGIGSLFKKTEKVFFHVFFIAGQVLSFLAFLFLVGSSFPPLFITLLITLTTAINGWSVHQYRHHLLWIPVLITSIGVYGSLFSVFDFKQPSFNIAYYLLGPLLFLLIAEWLGKYAKNGKQYFFWWSQLMNVLAIPIGYLLIRIEGATPWLYVLVLAVYIWSALRTKINWQRYVFTYVGFVTLYVQVLLVFERSLLVEYTMSLTLVTTAMIIIVLWSAANTGWKHLIEWYLIPFLHLVMFVHIAEVYAYGFPEKWTEVWAGLVTVLLAGALYLLRKKKWENATAAPLLLAFIYFVMYAGSLSLVLGMIVLFVLMAVMLLLSKRDFSGFIKRTESTIIIDFYRIFGLLYVIAMNAKVFANTTSVMSLEIFVSLLVVLYFLAIRVWTINLKERKIYAAAAITLCLYPYQVIVEQLPIPDVFVTEVYVVPVLIIVPVLCRKIFAFGKTTQIVELVIVSFLFFVLIFDALEGNTLTDALIIGTISLISLLFGFMMKYKSFFLAGTGTILLNIYMNTNSLWGQMPWWFYLIIGGILLIAVASFFEWKKQKENTTSKEILERNKQRIKNWFNKWS